MDVTPESARGEEPAIGHDDGGADDAAGFAEVEGNAYHEGESPSPLDDLDSELLLEALEKERPEAREQRQEGGEQGPVLAEERQNHVEPFAEYDLPQEPGELAEIEGRIRSLREQRRQAIDDFDRPSEARLTEEIEDLQLELLRAEHAGQARDTQAQEYQESYLAAVDAMEARYPEALDEQSAFHRILDNKIAAAQARRDPALGDPEFILKFADEVAGMLGGHGAAAVKTSRSQSRSRPMGSALAPGHQSAARPSRDQLSRMIHEMPLEELERLVCTE